MAESSTQQATVEVPAGGEGHGEVSVINVSPSMMALTWVTFAITAIVLYKAAWKPILAALDKREETIRQSLEDAEKARAELEGIEQARSRIIGEADQKARDIVEKARQGAVEAAHAIEAKARDEAQIMLENARREITAAQEKAMSSLRRESAELAIDISRRILVDNLDEARSRAIADSLISKL